MNSLLSRIRQGEKLCGTIVCLSDPSLCEIMANAGYDYIWIDMEHSYLSCKEVLCHLNTARSVGTAAIVRVPQDDLTVTKKVLEMGPDGIIFPMVRTAEEVNKLIDFTLYPPYGSRGFGPQAAVGYGYFDTPAYVKNTEKNVCRFIQIEHKEAVENLEEIIKNPYIDGYIFGPNDLSGSLGMLGDPFREEPLALIKHTISVLRENGKYIGTSIGETSPEAISYWHELGVDMISAGSDFRFLQMLTETTFQTLKNEHREK
jgi:2-dehydro-3-deoxyglucarate aldolase/4-hydroxy-2-oxoheptanedioate aldolase